MKRFSDMHPTERWRALDECLPALVARYTGSAEIPDDAEISLDDLAELHGTTARKMRNELQELGVKTYKIGGSWMVRRKSYARALDRAEELAR